MDMAILKIPYTKVSYLTMLYELTKNESVSSIIWGAEILSVVLSDQYNSFLISSIVEELQLLNQENLYVTFN